MSSVADKSSTVRRRYDAQGSRDALLSAADALFDERGYEATTVRDIGERAGVDAALIARYFGGKEGLYLATLEHERRTPLPADPMRILERMLSRSERRGIGPVPHAMVSPTLSDEMRAQVQQIIRRHVVEPCAAQLTQRAVPDAELRAEILVALSIGVSLTRASATLPALAEASADDLLGVLGELVGALQREHV
jgi:AcrR family transcriptional regulator